MVIIWLNFLVLVVYVELAYWCRAALGDPMHAVPLGIGAETIAAHRYSGTCAASLDMGNHVERMVPSPATLGIDLVVIPSLTVEHLIPNTVDLNESLVLVAMIMSLNAVLWPIVGRMLSHRNAYVWLMMWMYRSFVHTFHTWFVCDNRRAYACDGTNSRIVCTPCSTLRTGTVSQMNECAYAVFGPIRWQMFYHIHYTGKHEHLYADSEYAVANLMRQWIPEIKNNGNSVIQQCFHFHAEYWLSDRLQNVRAPIVNGQRNWDGNIDLPIDQSSLLKVTIISKYFVMNVKFGAFLNAWWNNHSDTKISCLLLVMLWNLISFCQTVQ